MKRGSGAQWQKNMQNDSMRQRRGVIHKKHTCKANTMCVKDVVNQPSLCTIKPTLIRQISTTRISPYHGKI